MFKFLRKYNKMLLSVFGVLLMITFLIPQAFNEFSKRAAETSGTVATVGNDESISSAEWHQFQQEVDLIEKLIRIGAMQQMPGVGQIKNPEQWYLLVREAKAAGVVPVFEPRDASDPSMQQLMAITGVRDPGAIRRTQEHYMGVAQLLDLYMTGDLYSDLRLRSEAERLMHGVTARTVVLQPDPADSSIEPTAEQIEEQMKKYADKLPGEGEHGFGYRLPNRVKIEWLTIPAQTIRTLTENSPAMDRVEQYRHWKKNPQGSFPPYPAEGAGAEIPDAVRNDLLNQLVSKQTDEIIKFATNTLSLARRGVPEKDGYLVLPENWETTHKTLPQLAEDLRKHFTIELPTYEARGDRWLNIDELASLPGIGGATTDKVSNTPVNLAALVPAAKEFGANSTIVIQEGVAGPPLRDAAGSLYIFRIIDTDTTRQPASVDEVREQVVKDLKRQAEYDRLKESLTAIESEARTKGLVEIALAHDTIVQASRPISLWNEQYVNMMAQYGIPLTPRPSELPIIGADKDTVQAIIDRAFSDIPEGVPAAEVPVDKRIFAVASDNKLSLVVVEVMSQQPLTREGFDRLVNSGAIQQMVSLEDADERRSVDKAFSLDALVKRNNFKFESRSEESDSKPEAGEEEPKTASAG